MNSTSFVPAATRTDAKIQNTGSNQPAQPVSDSVPSQTQADGHFNQITQKWESNGERPTVESSQGASTMPDADGGHEDKVSFGDKVNGFAKKFAGKATGKEHEVAQGEALLNGADKEQAANVANQVKNN
ncbi:uncharacterized protein JCM15063_004282 [Sporobolomyces koalae]|uniref:uncharacterized protein n=1 Tax=Sporobolomyces koalae TaxID=500713 RepID=UPI0031816940